MIAFPRIHIAESVLNRIMNTLEGDSPLALETAPAPVVPDPTSLGLALDEELQTPMPPADVPAQDAQDAQTGAFDSSVMGGSPFDGMLVG